MVSAAIRVDPEPRRDQSRRRPAWRRQAARPKAGRWGLTVGRLSFGVQLHQQIESLAFVVDRSPEPESPAGNQTCHLDADEPT